MTEDNEEVVVDDEATLSPDAVDYLAGGETVDDEGVIAAAEKKDDSGLAAAEDGYDEAKASDPVKKRIGKLTKKWRTAEQERDDYRTRAEASEKILEEREKERASMDETSFNDQESEIQGRIDKAVEDEDFAEMAKGTAAMRKLDQQRVTRQARPPVSDVPKPKPASKAPDIAPAAQEWIDKNEDWFDTSSGEYDERKAQRAMRLSKSVKAEYGYDNDDPDLYAEIDRRLTGVRAASAEEKGFQAPHGGDSTGVRRGGRQPVRNAREITDHDLANMHVFGFDRENMQDRRDYMKHKGGGEL